MRTKALVLTALLVTVIAVPQWLSQTRSFLYSPNLSVIATAEASGPPRINPVSPNRFYKGARIRVTGVRFGARSSSSRLYLVRGRYKARGGRYGGYPITIRSWSDTVVVGTLPGVSNGTYELKLRGSHGKSRGLVKVVIISRPTAIKNPSISKRFAPKVRLGKQLRNRRLCPDPAVVRIVPGWPTRNANGTYNFRLFAVIRNVGRVTYRSLRSQQQITLKQGNRVLKVSAWSSAVVPPGARGEVASEFFNVRNWNPNPGEFAANFSAHITYAPDIGNDGNPNNDDCRRSNNRKVLTVDALRRMLSRVR